MDVPMYMAAMVIATSLMVVLAVVVVLRRARDRANRQARVPEAVGWVLVAWIAGTSALGIAGVYRATSGQMFQGLVVPTLFVIGLGSAWMAATRIPSLRALIEQPATQPALVALQVWRLLAIAFLILLAQGQLPPLFALPAGIGDILAALAAPFVALRLHQPGGRSLALGWNVFGLLDLITAIGLGVTTNAGPLQVFYTDPSSAVLTVFPLTLFPTFFVPLSLLLHVLSVRHLLGGRTASAGARVVPQHV